jgi:hypothetical protein
VPSVTRIAKLYVPAVVGVPVSVPHCVTVPEDPVAVLPATKAKPSPGRTAPLAIEHVRARVPPTAIAANI